MHILIVPVYYRISEYIDQKGYKFTVYVKKSMLIHTCSYHVIKANA